MPETEDERTAYRERAKELRELAASAKYPEAEIALVAIALQYERLADQPSALKPQARSGIRPLPSS